MRKNESVLAIICFISFFMLIVVSPQISIAETKIVYNPEFQAGPEYNFRKVKWGMSIDEVKASENLPVAEEGVVEYARPGTYQVRYDDVSCAGHKAYLMYAFYQEKLIFGSYLIYSKTDLFSEVKGVLEQFLGLSSFTKNAKGERTAIIWEKGQTTVRLLTKNIPDEDGEYTINLTFYDSTALLENPF